MVDVNVKADKIVNVAYKKVGFIRKPFRRKIRTYLLCALSVVILTIVLFLFTLYMTIMILINGPSEKTRQMFVATLEETSIGGFFINWFVPEREVDFLVTYGDTPDVKGLTNTDLIQIDPKPDKNDKPINDSEDNKDENNNGIEIINIVGSTYRGKLCIIEDPSRVRVGVCDSYGADSTGMELKKIVAKYGGVLGVNASGFEDDGGSGNGAMPTGVVINEGNLLWGDMETQYEMIAFNKNHVLILDTMTPQYAIDNGIEYAVSFGPVLIKNGEAVYKNRGLNPRTAIGQRADGAILLLVIEGRQVSSAGATLSNLTNILMEYGAVNAANLDGGSSSSLYYDGGYVITGSYIFGMRKIPNAIVVLAGE